MSSYRVLPSGVGKAYGAYALVRQDDSHAHPAGYWAPTDFSAPAVDGPTFYATTGESIGAYRWVRGTITYDGPIRSGRCYFTPSGTRQRIAIPAERIFGTVGTATDTVQSDTLASATGPAGGTVRVASDPGQ